MASFCKQCSVELFGQDFGDMAGIVTEEQSKQGYAAGVLCEGCGYIQVDCNGVCLSNCDKQHQCRCIKDNLNSQMDCPIHGISAQLTRTQME